MRRIVRDYTRAAGGGLLIGMPLLFTQEVWQQGFTLPPSRILALFAVAFVIVLGYNAISGFRADQSATEVVIDAVEAMGLGIVVAAVVLTLLGRIELGISLRDALGKVALESIPIAFGASIARGQLDQGGGGESDAGEGDADRGGKRGTRRRSGEEGVVKGPIGPFARLFVAAGGGLLFALNVGPTDEILVLGMESSPWALIAIVAASLVVTLALVFFAEFGGGVRSAKGPLEQPVGETLAAYALSLLVALTILWAVGRTDDASVRAIAGMTVILGVAASLGAAVGRILVGGAAAE